MEKRANYYGLSHAATQNLLALDKILGESSIEHGLRNLVKIRASQLNGCIFCVDMHSKEARLAGEVELRLHHLAFWRESKLFSDRERAALEWTERLTRISGGVEAEEYRKVADRLSDQEISDLTFIIGSINMWNRLGVAFRPEPGSLDKSRGLDKVLALETAR